MQESVPVGAAEARPIEQATAASPATTGEPLADPRALQILSTEHYRDRHPGLLDQDEADDREERDRLRPLQPARSRRISQPGRPAPRRSRRRPRGPRSPG